MRTMQTGFTVLTVLVFVTLFDTANRVLYFDMSFIDALRGGYLVRIGMTLVILAILQLGNFMSRRWPRVAQSLRRNYLLEFAFTFVIYSIVDASFSSLYAGESFYRALFSNPVKRTVFSCLFPLVRRLLLPLEKKLTRQRA